MEFENASRLILSFYFCVGKLLVESGIFRRYIIKMNIKQSSKKGQPAPRNFIRKLSSFFNLKNLDVASSLGSYQDDRVEMGRQRWEDSLLVSDMSHIMRKPVFGVSTR